MQSFLPLSPDWHTGRYRLLETVVARCFVVAALVILMVFILLLLLLVMGLTLPVALSGATALCALAGQLTWRGARRPATRRRRA